VRALFSHGFFLINLVLRERLVPPLEALDPESPSVLDPFRRHIPAGIGTTKTRGFEVLSKYRERPDFRHPEMAGFFLAELIHFARGLSCVVTSKKHHPAASRSFVPLADAENDRV